MKKIITGALLGLAVSASCAGVDQKLKNFMAKSKKQRVAVIAIGDSNQQFGGHGWSKYMSSAILNKFGAYGTGNISIVNTVPAWSKAKGFRSKEAPNELDKQLFSYWYLPEGEKQKANWNVTGCILSPNHPMDIKDKLTYHLKYATFATGQGSFLPAVRKNKAPWSTIAKASAPVSTLGTKLEMKDFSFELKADPSRTYPILFSASPVNGLITGPFLGEFCAIENPAKTTGCTYQKLYGAGGHSLQDMLTNLGKKDGAKLQSYFNFIRKTLNADKSCIVMINSGLNDRNSKAKSAGPEKKSLACTQVGYKDNLKGLVMLLEKNWLACGGKKNTIHFAFMPSHPISTPDDKKLVQYRQAAQELASELPNASCIMLPEIVSQKTMQKNGYYDKGGNSHLTRKGYQKISEAVTKAMVK